MESAQSHLRMYVKWYILLSLFVLSLVLWSIILHEDHKGILTFAVLNIGQGDSLFIESSTGTQVLIDGGPDKNLMREISQVMPWYDRNIDMIVVTNSDKDHFDGFIPLLEKYKVDVVLEPGTNSATSEYAFLEKEIAKKNIPKVLARRGQKIDLGGGAYLEILFPDRDVSKLASNDGSIVMWLVYGETKILLEGDSTERIETYLTNLNSLDLKSTILKVAHHGSKTSSSKDFVRAVSPELAVISAGENNKYGHPTKETLATMEELKIPTFVTCNMGRITFRSDGHKFTLQNKNMIPPIAGCLTK